MNSSLEQRVRRWSYCLLILATALGASACGFFHHGGTPVDNTSITAAEIDSVHAASAYDAVRKLRPQFLEPRGRMSVDPKVPPGQPNVYVDNQYYGDISTLRTISASVVETIKFYNASEAEYAFGRGNMAGVISILTKH